jgi:hypothetical protein
VKGSVFLSEFAGIILDAERDEDREPDKAVAV